MNVGPTSREDLLTKYGGPHFSDSREMHVPVASSSATMPDPNPSQSWSFRENPQRFYAAENGNGTFDYSQSFEGSKQRSSLSPSALGSGSQTSLTTYEGSQPSSLGNTTSLRFKANDIPLESSAGTTIAQHGSHISEDHTVQHHSSLNGGRRASQPTILSNETRTSGQWPRANPIQDADVNDISSMSHIPPTGSSRPRVDSVSGQKRTAAGAIKASSEEDPHGLSKDGTWRPRSKTIGSPSRGRIAEVNLLGVISKPNADLYSCLLTSALVFHTLLHG